MAARAWSPAPAEGSTHRDPLHHHLSGHIGDLHQVRANIRAGIAVNYDNQPVEGGTGTNGFGW